MTGLPLPLLLTGRTAAEVRGLANALADHVDQHPSTRIADLGRSLLEAPDGPHRAIVLAGTGRDDLARSLRKLAAGMPASEVVSGSGTATGGLAFVFPGQGSQRPGMCRDLYERFPAFARAFDEVAREFAPLLDTPMREAVFSGGNGDAGPLALPGYAHSAMFAVEYALVALLGDFGVRPDVVGGYSGGEDVAAVVAGVVSLPDMCGLVVARARAIEDLAPPGGMMAVQASRAEIESLLPEGLHIAGLNGPRSVVVAGPDDLLDRFSVDLARELSARSRRIQVDNPFHTPYLRPTVAHFTSVLPVIPGAAPTLPFVSSVTGQVVDGPLDVVSHWGRHFERPVLFASVVDSMLGLGVTTFLEVGPGGTLTAMVRGVLGDSAPQNVVPSLRKNFRDGEALLTALAELRVRGVGVDFSGCFEGADLVALPGATGEAAPAEVDPIELVDAHVAASLGVTGLANRQRATSFRDLGFDSVLGVELRHRLSAATGLDLALTVVFDHPTPAALAEHIARLSAGDPLDSADAGTVEPARAENDDPVAIVGMACRLPGGAGSPDELWQLLVTGSDVITQAPAGRGWTGDTWLGGFLHDAGDFDPGFFGIPDEEALTMDPQQRLLLESSWAALEDAGLDPSGLRGSRAGVFVGGMAAEYGPSLRDADVAAVRPSLTGRLSSVLSGRISYVLGLTGPSMSIDTACSSSLVALHLAAASVRAGECSLALAGGVTVMPDAGVLAEFRHQGGLAADGRCKAFSADADGTGFAEGVAVLVLQRRSAALRDGRPVLALVRGSAVNSDGASNGLTAPSGPAQQQVLRQALRAAGLAPSDVDVVEAHGTGTRLGDPIEARALEAVYGRDRAEPLLIGSVKSNLGHPQAAAGVVGVVKMVLALRNGIVPATLHVSAPTSAVSWSGLRPVVAAVPWPRGDRPRRAGISSFGISGTNAHVIIEEGDASAPHQHREDGVVPWVLSARSDRSLRAAAARLGAVDADPVDVGWTLLTTRGSFEHRAVVLAADAEGRSAALTALASGEPATGLVTGLRQAGGLAIVFPGQGSLLSGTGAELAKAFPAFDSALRDVLAHLPDSVAEAMAGGDTEALTATENAQPALFALEVALFRLIESFGVRPDFVSGHSVGEIAACHVAGVLSLADAARLVTERGRLMGRLPAGGGMAAVEATVEDVRPLLGDDVVVAAVNGPSSVVIAGRADRVREVLGALTARGLRGKPLKVGHAFHSPQVDPILSELEEVAAGLTFRRAAIPVVSTVTGARVDGEVASPAYWADHARRPVLFADAVTTLREQGVRTFLEAGPGRTLSALVGTGAVPMLDGDSGEEAAVLSALAEVHVRGTDVDFAALLSHGGITRLPTYSFDRRTFWLGEGTGGGSPTTTVARAAPGLEAELAGLPPAERLELVLSVVRRELGFVLPGGTAAAAELSFADLGLNSLSAVRLRDRLTAATGIAVPATVAYDCPTPAALARHLLDRLSPEETRPTDAALRALDVVAGILPGLGDDRAGRARVLARLSSLLTGLDAPGTPATTRDGTADLAEVSTDEFLALIDQELEAP